VFKDDDGQVVHQLAGDLTGPQVTGRIDADRRRGHMQHHSAQHILSAAIYSLYRLNTLSAKISVDTPATIDIPDTNFNKTDLVRIERLANEIVFDNRLIKTYFITDDEVGGVPFRRPPKVSGNIRVVEVVGFDFSACGGTHCPAAGMIGTVKIVKTERQNQKLRIYFAAGLQALTYFQQYYAVAVEIANELSSGLEELPQLVRQQTKQLKQLQKELKQQQAALFSLEVEQLAARARRVGPITLVTTLYEGRPASELRELGKLLQQRSGYVALLAVVNQDKLALVVSCAGNTGLNARELLVRHLAMVEGRGGGDAKLAQGGGAITGEQATIIFEQTSQFITELLN
jgi:alanyl-tRNA synthetase